ncbi:MAG: 2-hydroxychromene-2-carboxylate isomerase [Proteobacteria bacterium]|nr:2-hydroxychromene-2-carboxylate isomerase [Pseudomonadota bacterium]
MSAPIRFYFDLVSTYSYLAIGRIDDLAARYGRKVDWIAVSLGHIFQSLEIKPPPFIPARLKYNTIDLLRSAEFAGVPFKIPDPFPFDAKVSRYAFWSLKARDPRLARDFAIAVMTRAFGEGRNITTAAEVADACGHLGLSLADIETAAANPAAKRAVVEAMDSAKADGMIGAPFMVLDGEPFWGADRLEHLERRLKEKS